MAIRKLTAKKVMKAAKNPLEKHVAQWIIDRSVDYDNDFCGPLRDLFYGGCVSGMVGHLIYYKDCVPFAKKYNKFILEYAIEEAEEQGYKNVFDYLSRLNSASDIGNVDQFWGYLSWYGFETAARKIADRIGYDQ